MARHQIDIPSEILEAEHLYAASAGLGSHKRLVVVTRWHPVGWHEVVFHVESSDGAVQEFVTFDEAAEEYNSLP